MTLDKKLFLSTVTTLPGVYQMFSGSNKLLYVGKARNLKNRLASYFHNPLSTKTQSLMSQVERIEVIVTHSENEALLLECNLIKQHRPRYNILLRDDKSYPYIFISDDEYPRLAFYRSRQLLKNPKGRYFGPYPHTAAARDMLQLLQKLFLVRQCTNTFFSHRTRPCLQYQIKRCTAPCVKHISVTDYQRDVDHAQWILSGQNEQLLDTWKQAMDQAAATQHYEQAAHYRDKIYQLRMLQEQQSVSNLVGDADVIVVARHQELICVQVVTVRHGKVIANQSHYPSIPEGSSDSEILSAFIPQYYLFHQDRPIPQKIVTNHPLSNQRCLQETLTAQAQYRVLLRHRAQGETRAWLTSALLNAQYALNLKASHQDRTEQRFRALQHELKLTTVPKRIECFDISHTAGTQTVASCVVFNRQGSLNSHYRRFNINGITPGDDYAAMYQVIKRRYARLTAENHTLPDIVLIDGGKGQLAQAEHVLSELGISDILLIAIAKGPQRKAGLEILHIPNREELRLPADSQALHLLQQIRDEAHRFAITGHKKRRERRFTDSSLEHIEGIGTAKRRELLRYFGGLQGIARASVDDLMKVNGISQVLAQRIYDALHGSE